MADLASLLRPATSMRPAEGETSAKSDALRDLDVAPLIQALTGRDPRRERFVTGVLAELCTNPAVIEYRAEVMTNLLQAPELRENLARLLPQITSLVEERRPLFASEWTLSDVVRRLGELELYVDVTRSLSDALADPHVSAPAFLALRRSVDELIQSPVFETLSLELPRLRARLEGAQSVTIGVNLSGDLRPESAAILSIDTERIEGKGTLLQRLLGEEAGGKGLSRLRGGRRRRVSPFFPPMTVDAFGHENAIVADLQRLIENVVAPVGEAVERYVRVHTRDFATLESELSFLLHGVSLAERLRRAGLPTCRPEIAPIEDRSCHLEQAYSVSLALRMMSETTRSEATEAHEIVTNDVTFDAAAARVWILTGPNRGGKTTFVRGIGLAQLLFQAGLPVPARAARLSPSDAVYTHFPTVESASPGEGRLDDEAGRLAHIFRQASPHSLILLNEVLSGTSTVEALELAYDAVRGLHLLGARSVYVTHLHELGKYVEEINSTTAGDGVVGSLVAEMAGEPGRGETIRRRTFRIRPSPPLGRSYASEIAEQHGISYEQLVQLLRERGVITQPEPAPMPPAGDRGAQTQTSNQGRAGTME